MYPPLSGRGEFRLLLSLREPLPLREKSSERPAGILAFEESAPIASGFFHWVIRINKNDGNRISWPAGRGEGVNSWAGRHLSLYLYHSRNGCFVTLYKGCNQKFPAQKAFLEK